MPTTRDYTDYLNDKIDIAPVNSQEELQAAELIEKLFAEHGLETELQEFETPTISGLTTKIYLVLLFVGIVLSGFLGTSAMAGGLVLVAASFTLIVLARLGNDVFGQIGPQARSQNAIGVHRASGPNVIKGNRPIVIVAHYDTPRENPLYRRPLAQWQPLLKRYSWHLSIFVVVMAFLQIMGFIPAGARHVFWALGILAALPLLLLGAASIYERFAPCTTGANDNKASIAAMLGVLDMVRPATDDAKAWALNHPKGVRRPIEELYGTELEDDELYDEDEPFDEEVETYDEEDEFFEGEGDVESEEYEDSDAEGVGAFEGAAAYAGEEADDFAEESDAYADEQDEAEEFVEDYDDEESLDAEYEEYDADFDDEYGDDWLADDDAVHPMKPVKPGKAANKAKSAKVKIPKSKRAAKKQSDARALREEIAAKLVAPTTVRRGASVLESLQVLPETCEVAYVGLAPREEVLDRLTREAQSAKRAEVNAERLRKVGGGFSSIGSAIAKFFAAIAAFFAGLVAKLHKEKPATEVDAELVDAPESVGEPTAQDASTDDSFAYDEYDDEYDDEDEYDEDLDDEYGDEDDYDEDEEYDDEYDEDEEEDDDALEAAPVSTHVPVEVVEATALSDNEWFADELGEDDFADEDIETSPELEAQVSERLSLPSFDHIYNTLPDRTGISREAADAWLAEGSLTPQELELLAKAAAAAEAEIRGEMAEEEAAAEELAGEVAEADVADNEPDAVADETIEAEEFDETEAETDETSEPEVDEAVAESDEPEATEEVLSPESTIMDLPIIKSETSVIKPVDVTSSWDAAALQRRERAEREVLERRERAEREAAERREREERERAELERAEAEAAREADAASRAEMEDWLAPSFRMQDASYEVLGDEEFVAASATGMFQALKFDDAGELITDAAETVGSTAAAETADEAVEVGGVASALADAAAWVSETATAAVEAAADMIATSPVTEEVADIFETEEQDASAEADDAWAEDDEFADEDAYEDEAGDEYEDEDAYEAVDEAEYDEYDDEADDEYADDDEYEAEDDYEDYDEQPVRGHVPVEVVDVPSLVDVTTSWSFDEPADEVEVDVAVETESAPVAEASSMADAYIEGSEVSYDETTYQDAAYETVADEDDSMGIVGAIAEDAAESVVDFVEDATDLANEFAGAVGSAVASAADIVSGAVSTAAEAMGVASEAVEDEELQDRTPIARDFFRARMLANRARAAAEEEKRAAEAEAAARAEEARRAEEAEAAAAAAQAEEAWRAAKAEAAAKAEEAAKAHAAAYVEPLTPAPVWGESALGSEAASEVDVRPAAWDEEPQIEVEPIYTEDEMVEAQEDATPVFEPVAPRPSDTAVLHQLFATAPMPIYEPEPEPEPVPDISGTGVLHNLFASMPTIEPFVPTTHEPEPEVMPEVELTDAYSWQQDEDELAYAPEPEAEEESEDQVEDKFELVAEDESQASAWDEEPEAEDETQVSSWDEPENELTDEEAPEAEDELDAETVVYAWDDEEPEDESEPLPEVVLQEAFTWQEDTPVSFKADDFGYVEDEAEALDEPVAPVAPYAEEEAEPEVDVEPQAETEEQVPYAWDETPVEVEPAPKADLDDAYAQDAYEDDAYEDAYEDEYDDSDDDERYQVSDSDVDAEFEAMISSMASRYAAPAEPEIEPEPEVEPEPAADAEDEYDFADELQATIQFERPKVLEPEEPTAEELAFAEQATFVFERPAALKTEVAAEPELEPESDTDITFEFSSLEAFEPAYDMDVEDDLNDEQEVYDFAVESEPEPESDITFEFERQTSPEVTFEFEAQGATVIEPEVAQSSPEQTISPDITFSMEKEMPEEELSAIDTTGLSVISLDTEVDVAAAMPTVRERIPKPRAVDDPEWGTSSFRPQVMTAGRRAMLLDLPDPSVREVDPFGTHADGNAASQVDVNQMRRFEVLRNVPSPLNDPGDVKRLSDEYARMKAAEAEDTTTEATTTESAEPVANVHPYNSDRNIGSRSNQKPTKRRGVRFGRGRRDEEPEIESMGEWLGLGDDFDAKKDGRQIGTWDNFADDEDDSAPAPGKGTWKGGATLRSGLRGDDPMGATTRLNVADFDESNIQPIPEIDGRAMPDEPDGMREFNDDVPIDPDASTKFDAETMNMLREAILRLGDDDLIAHDIWFVGLGASALDHGGMRAFLDEHRSDIRGAFLINLDSIGAGDLTLLTHEGSGQKQRADRRLGRMISSIADKLHIDMGRADMRWDETDATPALTRSVRVATIMGMSDDGVPALSQTNNDEPEYLNDQQISDVADIVAELIREA